ncbi:MAG: hypothetical protein E4H36_09110, partial [Spirochaetales bacterium]
MRIATADEKHTFLFPGCFFDSGNECDEGASAGENNDYYDDSFDDYESEYEDEFEDDFEDEEE